MSVLSDGCMDNPLSDSLQYITIRRLIGYWNGRLILPKDILCVPDYIYIYIRHLWLCKGNSFASSATSFQNKIYISMLSVLLILLNTFSRHCAICAKYKTSSHSRDSLTILYLSTPRSNNVNCLFPFIASWQWQTARAWLLSCSQIHHPADTFSFYCRKTMTGA